MPGFPKTSMPPARSMSSGVQFPAAISGSIHSMQATVGRSGAGTGVHRFCSSRMTGSASTPTASPTRRKSSQMSASEAGFSATSRGRAPEARGDGSFDIAQAHRADLALYLRQDVGRLQPVRGRRRRLHRSRERCAPSSSPARRSRGCRRQRRSVVLCKREARGQMAGNRIHANGQPADSIAPNASTISVALESSETIARFMSGRPSDQAEAP